MCHSLCELICRQIMMIIFSLREIYGPQITQMSQIFHFVKYVACRFRRY